jgi:hypothetical protein
MLIVKEKISKDKIIQMNKFFQYMVKGVVDIRLEIVALDAELHADLEELLLGEGSNGHDLYGFNILFDGFEIEYDSMINIPRNRELGYPRGGTTIVDKDVQKRIDEVIKKWINI